MKYILYLTLISLFLSGCCAKNGKPGLLCFGNPDFAVSPNRISKSQKDVFDKKITKLKYLNLCKKPTGCEIIGHGAASFRHYAMDINDDGTIEGNSRLFHKSKVKNITELIKTAFDDLKIDAVEIDVHVPPENMKNLPCENNKPCAFVMHNKPKWKVLNQNNTSEAYNYIKNNRLNQILSAYFSGKYNNKKIYLELKSPHKCMLPDADIKECKREPKIIADIVNSTSKDINITGRLGVISFSATYLKIFYENLNDRLRNKIEYALIAGHDNKALKKCLADCKGPVPVFSLSMQHFVIDTPWLDTVWFSTKALDNPSEIFNSITAARKKRGYKDLNFSLSVYDKGNALKIIKKKPSLNLKSVMIDIDD